MVNRIKYHLIRQKNVGSRQGERKAILKERKAHGRESKAHEGRGPCEHSCACTVRGQGTVKGSKGNSEREKRRKMRSSKRKTSDVCNDKNHKTHL